MTHLTMMMMMVIYATGCLIRVFIVRENEMRGYWIVCALTIVLMTARIADEIGVVVIELTLTISH